MRTKSQRQTCDAMPPPPGSKVQPIPAGRRAAGRVPVGPRARGLVRRAHLSPDKTVFVCEQRDRRAAERALAAGYLAPQGAEDVYRITADGEAFLATLMRSE